MVAADAIPPPIVLPPPTGVFAAAINGAEQASENAAHDAANAAPDDAPPPARPTYVYTRPQLVYLQKSPLVVTPPEMPALKDWFGDWHEQQSSSKKDSETTNGTSNGRDRRFRRDVEEGDSSRASFRSALSQPSQMGNFKHQPLRSSDREARERERDQRDKDAQDKLRSLSDKYDRDRLSLSASSSARGGKERELAPHLQTASGKNGTPTNGTPGRAGERERREPREPGKRRVGESDDWRRGDRGRDDQSDDRDDRERPRSRARDGSRVRRDPSTNRRERGDRDRDRDTDRDRDRDRRRGDRDRDRDDRRKDRDEPRRNRDGDRDREREKGDDDDRHWRDDGRREERLASRRDRDRGGDRDRDWERGGDRDRWPRSDRARDDEAPSRRDRDKDRWDTEDREAKPKRGERGGRDRRNGGGDDKEDRKDRDKDKTPAWMDTYVPTASGGGILGGKGDDGELDELQAWKKTMKERELAKAEAAEPVKAATPTQTSQAEPKGLDEIQQFKLMMQQAQINPEPGSDPVPAVSTKAPVVEASTIVPEAIPAAPPGIHATPSVDPSILDIGSQSSSSSIPTSSAVSQTTSATSTSNNPLLAMLSPEGGSASFGTSYNDSQPAVSRMFPAQPASDDAAFGLGRVPAPSGHAPAVSRLASLGRGPALGQPSNKLPGVSSTPTPPGMDFLLSGVGGAPGLQPVLQMQDDFSRLGLDAGGMRDRFMSDAVRGLAQPPGMQQPGAGRLPDLNALLPAADPRGFMSGSPVHHLNDMMGALGGPGVDASSAANNKGSRFAKLWENEGRRGPPAGGMPGSADLNSFGPGPIPREMDMGQFGIRPEANMNDILAMLNGSHPQPQRSLVHQGRHTPPSNLNSFSTNYPGQLAMQQLQQQHLQQQRYPSGSRQEIHPGPQAREDRQFLPDGMVPGLRGGPTPGRQNFYNEQYDDGMSFGGQRLAPSGRVHDQLLPGQIQSAASLGHGRNAGLPQQQPMYGRGPSPHQMSVQRGQLQHLGSRPPHDPQQFMGMGGHQQPFNGMGGTASFGGGGGGGHPQMRGGPPLIPAGPGGMLDMRGAQSQMLSPGQGGGVGGGARASGYGLQQQQGISMPPSRQQMPPQFSSQMGGGGMLPAQMSPPLGQDPQANPLMALLLGRSNDGQMR